MSRTSNHAHPVTHTNGIASLDGDAADRGFQPPSMLGRSNSKESAASTFEISFHGNCPHCHHRHDKFPIRLFKNKKKHKRLQCAKCEKHLFGIGGNSTQTTLISQQTISRPGSWPSAAGESTDFHGCTDAQPSEQFKLTDGNLKTIAELSPAASVVPSAFGSRQPSQRSARPKESSRTSVLRPDASPSIAPTVLNEPPDLPYSTLQKDSAISGVQASPKTVKRVFTHSERLRNVKNKVESKVKTSVKKLIKKVKQINSRVREPLKPGHVRPTEGPPNSTNLHIGTIIPEQKAPSNDSRDRTADSIDQRHSTPQQAHGYISNEQTDNAVDSAPRDVSVFQTVRVTAADEESELSQEERAQQIAKRLERINAIRKEKTLHALASKKPKCECTDGCQCMKGGTESQSSGEGHRRSVDAMEFEPHRFAHGVEPPDGTASSGTIESRRLSTELPSDGRPDSSRRLDWVGLDERFINRRRRSSQDTGSSRVGGRVRPWSSFSTFVGSNDSSISLSSSAGFLGRQAAGSRPHTPLAQLNTRVAADDDQETDGPTPTQQSTTARWEIPIADSERVAHTIAPLLNAIETEPQDSIQTDHDGSPSTRTEDPS